jgi:protein disulfide-isomerase
VVHTITTVKWHSDIGEAAAMARQSGRPMLIRISADWCSYCQKMKRETFADFRVVRDINQNFIAVDLDADTNGSIVKQLRITSLPTVLVVSPDLRILAREEGFRSAAQIGRLMHRHMQRAQLETGFTIASR